MANIIKWKPFLINSFFILNIFEVKESILHYFSKLPCLSDLEKLGQLLVLKVLEGTVDWVLWIFIISSFVHFRGQGIYFSQFHKATIFGWPQNTRSTSSIAETWGYWWLGLINFRKFFILYIFGAKELISRCFSKLPCPHIPGDLEYPGQLPVFAGGNLVA